MNPHWLLEETIYHHPTSTGDLNWEDRGDWVYKVTKDGRTFTFTCRGCGWGQAPAGPVTYQWGDGSEEGTRSGDDYDAARQDFLGMLGST